MTSACFLLTLFLVGSLGFRLTRLLVAIRKAKSKNPGRTSARPIFWVMTVAYLTYIALCYSEGLRHADAFSGLVSVLGFFIYIGALVLRERAMRDLGRFFSPDIEIRNKHQVVREGLYRYMRHPLLACMGWEIIGVGLVFNAYSSLLWMGLGFYMPLIGVRMLLEERTLVHSLGESYRIYQREVGAFWPKLNV